MRCFCFILDDSFVSKSDKQIHAVTFNRDLARQGHVNLGMTVHISGINETRAMIIILFSVFWGQGF